MEQAYSYGYVTGVHTCKQCRCYYNLVILSCYSPSDHVISEG